MIAWIVLLAATMLAVYVVIGYPILLAMRLDKNAPPVRKDLNFTPSVSVILAVYNGAAFIQKKIETLFQLNYPANLIEFVIVSDGSTDETESIIRSIGDPRVRLIVQAKAGKSAALNAALQVATGDVLFFTDVRQPLEKQSLRHLVANFADPTIGAVTGKLVILKGDTGEQADMDLYWRYELWARSRHSEIYSLFNTTGCIYAMRRNLVEPIPTDTLSDDAAIPLIGYFRGYRIIFDPEAVAYDYPAIAGTEFRRRFRNLAGLWQVHTRFPKLFSGSNPMRLHFLSHKFGRLALPWVIVAIYVSTALLPESGWRTFLLWNEALLILLAVGDRFVPRKTRLKRITSPARTFFAMNLAAMVAVQVFFISANRLWVPTQVSNAAQDKSKDALGRTPG